MKPIVATLLLLGCALGMANAQSTQQPAFDVVSIRPHNPKLPGPTMTIPLRGEISIVGMTVRELIRFAYNIQQDYQLAGAPKWIDSERYDIRAKAPEQSGGPPKGGSALDVQRLRMQQLLADRFGLKLHHEMRQSQVYFLTVAKTGLKMQPASGTDPKAPDKGTIIPWTLVARELSSRIGAPVVDKTNLSGSYYMKLRYSTIEGHAAGIGIPSDRLDDNDPGPFFLTAIQEQLGLRLDAGKGPIDILVIDSVSRPSEN